MDKHIARAYKALTLNHDIRKVVVYVSPKCTIKLTRQRRDRRSSHHTYLLTVGAPNYVERFRIKELIAVREKFPVRKAQLIFYPKKKKTG